jgi:hypothetical protein
MLVSTCQKVKASAAKLNYNGDFAEEYAIMPAKDLAGSSSFYQTKGRMQGIHVRKLYIKT